MFRDGNPSGIKALMALHPAIGHPESLRLPLVPVSDATRSEIASLIPSLIN